MYLPFVHNLLIENISEASIFIKIISGGQTGVDRAALDWSIDNGVSHSGWCPKGRRAEDGVIPDHYLLQETESKNYKARTRKNIQDSDSTLIVSMSSELTGGSLQTRDFAVGADKPYLHVCPGSLWREQISVLLATNSINILNVAGPRASKAPDVERFVYEVLDEMKYQLENL